MISVAVCVFKTRLNKNMHRSIVWAQAFGRMTDTELRAALNQGDLLELCDEE